VTVTGSSGAIGWCGEVWNLPGDSGVQKEVCPTTYTLTNTGTNRGETWIYNRGTYPYFNSLRLRRNMNPSRFVGVNYAYNLYMLIYLGTSNNAYYFWSPTNQNPPSATADSNPTAGDYRLNSKYFGSAISWNGVTFSWAQGQGW
jgi:hypothetical protein